MASQPEQTKPEVAAEVGAQGSHTITVSDLSGGQEAVFRYTPSEATHVRVNLFDCLQPFVTRRFGAPAWRQQLLHAGSEEPLDRDTFAALAPIPTELTLVMLAEVEGLTSRWQAGSKSWRATLREEREIQGGVQAIHELIGHNLGEFEDEAQAYARLQEAQRAQAEFKEGRIKEGQFLSVLAPPGVTYGGMGARSRSRFWRATVTQHGREVTLGHFPTTEKAAAAVRAAEESFARGNVWAPPPPQRAFQEWTANLAARLNRMTGPQEAEAETRADAADAVDASADPAPERASQANSLWDIVRDRALGAGAGAGAGAGMPPGTRKEPTSAPAGVRAQTASSNTANTTSEEDGRRHKRRRTGEPPQTGEQRPSGFDVAYWDPATRGVWDRAKVRAAPHSLFVFGENDEQRGTTEGTPNTQAEIRGERNAFGFRTCYGPGAGWRDDTLAENKAQIEEDIRDLLRTAERLGAAQIIFPGPEGDGRAGLPTQAPRTYAYMYRRLNEEFGYACGPAPAPETAQKREEEEEEGGPTKSGK